MFLNKRIKASGIAEVVIALAVISMCFTVASLVFIRSNSAPMKFQDVKTQTEIQSEAMKRMFLQEELPEDGDFNINKEIDEFSDSLEVVTYSGSDERTLWVQQVLRIRN